MNIVLETIEPDPSLTSDEVEVLFQAASRAGLEWWLASDQERKILRKLKKLGLVVASSTDTKQGQRVYRVTEAGYRLKDHLENGDPLSESVGPGTIREAVAPSGGLVIWYDPKTGEHLQSADRSHGLIVFDNYSKFGFRSEDSAQRLYDDHDDDAYAFLRSVIRRSGWVRISLGYPEWKGKPSVQAATVRDALKATRWLADNGMVRDNLTLDTLDGMNVTLRDDAVDRFIKHGVVRPLSETVEPETIREAVHPGNYAPLYHGTTFPGLLQILATDTLGRTDTDAEHGGGFVCASRSPHWAQEFVSAHVGTGSVGAVVLVLDQRALRQRYRITPYDKPWDELDAQYKADEGDDWMGPVERFDEQEERIHGIIKPLSRYLLSIQVDEKYLRALRPDTIGWVTAADALGGDEAVRRAITDLLRHPLLNRRS